MHTTVFGVFLLPHRLDLAALLSTRAEVGAATGLAEVLAARGLQLDPPPVDGLTIDDHRASADAHVSQLVAVGPIDLDGRPAEVRISPLGTGIVVLDADVDDIAALGAFEEEMVPAANREIASISAIFRPGPGIEPNDGGLPTGELLWWHRVLHQPGPAAPDALGRFGVDVDDLLTVGDGYTALHRPDLDVDAVVRGLTVATEDWLVIDRSNRAATRCTVALRSARDAGDAAAIDAVVASSTELASDLELWLLVIEERTRFLANEAAATRRAAHAAWEIGGSLDALRTRTAALQVLAEDSRREITRALDERRNALLFLMAGLAALQGLLVLIDFLAGPAIDLVSGARVAIGCAALLVAAAMAVVTLRPSRSREARP